MRAVDGRTCARDLTTIYIWTIAEEHKGFVTKKNSLQDFIQVFCQHFRAALCTAVPPRIWARDDVSSARRQSAGVHSWVPLLLRGMRVPRDPGCERNGPLVGGAPSCVRASGLYHYIKWWWVEFTTINLMYILSNLFTAVVEGFFNEAYLRYLEIWSLMILLFFFLALRLNPLIKRASTRNPKQCSREGM